ncbi:MULTISPECIES: hypothetical protein [Mesorhizobium]|uniref:hypothetical protein n=1 Tax=Mesorhizobium TaxID=68287 RepID=UPI0010A97597|nr:MULTISPECIES: hypothetical protein [Mesorhizobium]
MNDIALSSLRVAAEIDAAKYKTGADQKVASDRAMIASAQAIGTAFSQTDTKISTAGDSLAKLSRQYLDGYKNQERFEQGLRQIGRQLDSGKTDIEGATRLLVGMNQKLGLSADVSELAAKGQTQLAAAVSIANTQIEGQAIALQQAAVAHAALIAQARADQAAENSRQMATANQGSFNSVLGVSSPSSGAQASASVFEAEFTRLEQMARLRAQQAGAAFADEFNSSVMATSGKSARASASVFEEAGREADQMASRVAALRAELDPAAAAQDRLNNELSEYSALAAKGAISAEELAQAQTMARNRIAANQNGSGGANKFAGMNATSQLQDIAITSMMGQSIPTIALQQGTQLGMAMQMAMGEQGAAGGAKALLAGLTGLVSPVNLVAIGLTAVVAAGIQFGSKLLPQTKSLKDATEEQRKAVNDLADAYGNASLKADDFYKKSVIASESDARRKTEALQKSSGAANVGAFSDLINPFAAGQGFITARDQFSAFNEPIKRIVAEAHNGRPDFAAFEKSIAAVVGENPGLQSTADKILAIVAAATAAAAQLKNTGEAIKDINRSSIGNFDRTQQAGRDQSVMSQRFGDDPFAAQREQQRQKEIALTEAQDQRKRSLDNTLASAKLDVDLIGKTTAETEGLRMAFQLEQQVREEAARNNVDADEAEIARIKAKAIEYGKLRALQEARDTIHGQEIDLETQRSELGLVGENTLARQRSASALKTEQDIRKLGIPLYGQEANEMRANTSALSANAEAMAKASLQADLLFDRRQILRNSEDQQIASALKSAGQPEDLNSQEAQMMRYNMALSETKDTFKGFFTDMADGLKQGKSLWESLEGAAVNALSKIADKLIDRGLDGIFNSIFGGESTGSGLLGDLLSGKQSQSGSSAGASSLLGKLFGGAGGQSVGSMQVQAASVFVNGAPVGLPGVGSLGSLLGGSSFKADTTLSDILGYGGGDAANQNIIQTRIDQAFGTGGSAQDMIQSRIDQAFGTTSGGLGGIFSPSGGFASSGGGAASAMSLGGGSVTDMIRRAAAAEGINPDIFLKVAKSEGGLGGFVQSSVFKNGIQEPSFGPMQLLKGGPGTGFPKGLGNAFEEQTGLSVSDPANMEAGIQFAAKQAKQSGWSQWYGAKAAGVGKWEGINRGDSGIDPMTTQSIAKLGDASTKATGALGNTTSALGNLGGASEGLISQFSKMGQSLMSQLTPATSSSSWFQGLSGMFGGSSGALGFMNSISPKATGDILSGSWGLFADGTENAPSGWAWVGERGPELRKLRAGDVIRSNPRSMEMAANQSGGAPAANDRPAQAIHQTNNFIFRENPATPASQNQIAAKSARALEKLQRTA